MNRTGTAALIVMAVSAVMVAWLVIDELFLRR